MSASIPLNNILIGRTASTWQEAIQTAAAPLATNKSITEEYVHQMVKSVDKLGSYIVSVPGFTLAHALPGSFVLHTDTSAATFREPIGFHSKSGPTSVMMRLACIDRIPHIEQLQVIAKKLIESGSIDKIAACKNKEESFPLFREQKSDEIKWR